MSIGVFVSIEEVWGHALVTRFLWTTFTELQRQQAATVESSTPVPPGE